MRESNSYWPHVRPAILVSVSLAVLGPGAMVVRADDLTALEEIVVTATKREERLLDVPISITVLNGDYLEDIGAVDFADFARFVPALDFSDRGSGQNRITIRGVSPDDGVQTTGMYIDEVPTNSATAEQFDIQLYDIESIEVLRGPQGTLYGEGSMGGAVRVLTAKPNAQGFEGSSSAKYLSVEDGDDGYRINAMVNLPLVEDKFAIRLVGYAGNEPGYIDNVYLDEGDVNDEDSLGGRVAATWFATDRLTVSGTVFTQNVEAGGRQYATSAQGELEQNVYVSEGRDDDFTISNLVIEYNFDWASLVSSSSVYERDTQRRVAAFSPGALAILDVLTNGEQPTIPTIFDEDYSAYIQELRLVSTSDGAIEWVIGAFYKDYDDDITSDLQVFDALLAGVFGAPPLGIQFADRNFKQSAVFGNLTWNVTDKFNLGIGGRYFEEDQRNVNGSVDPTTGARTTTPPIRDGHFSAFAPRVTFGYTISENSNLYGLVADGFRSGGVNGNPSPTIPPTYDADKVRSYEIGYKAVSRKNRVQFETAIYYNDWTDMQVTDIDPMGFLAYTSNAGEAHTSGIEVSLTAMPTDRLTLRFAGNYTEAELDEDVPAAGAVSGDKLQSVPEESFSVSGDYRWPFGGSNVSGRIRADYNYVGSSYSDFANATAMELDGYGLLNLRAGLEGERWQAHFFVDNATNEIATLVFQPDGLGPALGAPAEDLLFRNRPRTYGIEVFVDF